MKLKIIGLTIVAVAVYSCASKSAVTPTPPTPPTPPKNEVAKTSEKNSKAIVMTAELAVGKTAYENNCAKCHKLFEPKEFSKDDWAPILVKMQKKAHLSDVEMAPITNYIYTQL